MEIKRALTAQTLEQKNWRMYTTWFQILLQSYSNQNCVCVCVFVATGILTKVQKQFNGEQSLQKNGTGTTERPKAKNKPLTLPLTKYKT